MNDQSKMMMNLSQMNQSQMMKMNPPQIINQSQSQSQTMKMNPPQIVNQSQSQFQGMNQQMMNQNLPPMMNRGGYKVWSQQLPLDPNMKFQNPNLKPNFAKPGRSNNNSNNWKGKKGF
ncbi:hypothetical protein KIW84_066466 [Lathyrus oleraceus]|uniref:Uncharacterized protein n=1 Tax=Pisum sativum TaxID=3888 RepID=A0A9D4WFV6_PEA|nr:hypothetical protein KIW84_066466 [Pisum sativum]